MLASTKPSSRPLRFLPSRTTTTSDDVVGIRPVVVQAFTDAARAFRDVGLREAPVTHLEVLVGAVAKKQSDASATADHNHGLPKELRFTVDGRGGSYGAHRSSDSTSILLAALPARARCE